MFANESIDSGKTWKIKQFLEGLQESGVAGIAEISHATGIRPGEVETIIRTLEQQGEVEASGVSRSGTTGYKLRIIS